MSNQPSRGHRGKPNKPYSSFPLTAHNNGQWCKKIRGQVYFFGVWDDPQAALNNYLRVAADLHAGRQPQTTTTVSPDEMTVKDVCNAFLGRQLAKIESNAIGPRWFDDCRRTVTDFAHCIGVERVLSDVRPEDFRRYRQKLVQRGAGPKGRAMGAHTLSRSITVIKEVFKYAYDNDLIDRPMKFGTGFDKPSATLKRKARQAAELKNGKRLFAHEDIGRLIAAASPALKSMILLAINGGMGNTDCGRLPESAVDLDRAVVEFARPKTGIERVIPLWPETVQALRGTSPTARRRPKRRTRTWCF